MAGTDRPARRWAVAALWALTVALKVFPAAMGLVLLWQRRLRLIGAALISLVVLGALTLALAPASIWSDFVHLSVRVAQRSTANPYSGSLDSVAHTIWAPLADNRVLSAALLALRALAAGGLWWWGVRDADDDSQWAYGWLALMLIVPLVWWHYLWVAVAALGIVLARPAVDRKWLVALPVLAAVTVPLSLLAASSRSSTLGQGAVLVAAAVAVPVIARTARTPVPQN